MRVMGSNAKVKCAAIVSFVAALKGSASAQSGSVSPQALAEQLFRDGRALMTVNKINEACESFAESQRLDPGTGTLLNLADCHEKQNKLAQAWAELSQALAEARQQRRPDREKLASERIAVIEPKLGFLRFQFQNEGSNSRFIFELDRFNLTSDVLRMRIPVDPGMHTIVVTGEGKIPWQTKVTASSGQTRVVDFPGLADVVKIEEPKRLPWMLAAGVTVLSCGIGAGFGLAAVTNKRHADDGCPANLCDTPGWLAQRKYERNASISNVGFGLALASAAATTFLYVRYRRAKRTSTVSISLGHSNAMMRVSVDL
jgi:hypothetical protein